MTAELVDLETLDSLYPDRRDQSTGRWGWLATTWWVALSVLGTGFLLWATSVPGMNVVLAITGLGVLAIGGTGWSIPAIRAFRRWREARYLGHRPTDRTSRWVLAAPVAAGLVAVSLILELPVEGRWAASRTAFEQVAVDNPAVRQPCGMITRDERVPVAGLPARLGAYEIVSGLRLPCGVLFFEASANLFDQAGFAFLPSGPEVTLTDDAFPAPRFKPLGGGWYAFTAGF